MGRTTLLASAFILQGKELLAGSHSVSPLTREGYGEGFYKETREGSRHWPEVMQEKQNRRVGPTCAVSEPGGQTQTFRVCLSLFLRQCIE